METEEDAGTETTMTPITLISSHKFRPEVIGVAGVEAEEEMEGAAETEVAENVDAEVVAEVEVEGTTTMETEEAIDGLSGSIYLLTDDQASRPTREYYIRTSLPAMSPSHLGAGAQEQL